MAKSSAARKPPVAADAQPAAAPKHAAPELGAFEATDEVSFEEEEGPIHAPMHEGADSEMHFAGDIHADDMAQDWAPPTQLAAPDARTGMTQRWIRSSLLGKPDAKNTAYQGGQGWRPRALTSVPAEERKRYPTTRDARTSAEFMVNGDLVLCEMPTSRFNQMKAYYQKRASGQTEALVDANLAGSAVRGAERHGMGAPHVAERHSTVTTRRPIVAAD